MSIEVMKQALEALEKLMGGTTTMQDALDANQQAKSAITSLRQALANEALDRIAQNELELGIDYTLAQTNVGIGERAAEAYEAAKQRGWSGVSDERLMKMPDEPVAWRNAAIRVGEDLCSVGPFGYYDMTAEQWLDWALSVVTVHAPPRPQPAAWVGLTDEEYKELHLQMGSVYFYQEYGRAIEAKLKEKNT